MKCIMLTAIIGIAAATAAAQTPEALFRQGLKKYKAESYQEGVELFETALKEFPATPPFDRSLLHYNLGIGYYRTSRPEEAVQSFRESLKTPDISIQSRAYFNLGNSLYQTAKQTLNEGDVAKAFMLYQDAQTNYVQAMRLDAGDMDTKINYELTILGQNRILQLVAMAMSRLKQGDQLVNDYKFVEAAQWFQQNLPTAEKALSIEPEMKELFKQLTERSSKVAEIIAPSSPTPMPGGGP